MQSQRNATCADMASVNGLIRTRYKRDVCVVCAYERVHTPQGETDCPECGGSVRRSFALFRELREEQR